MTSVEMKKLTGKACLFDCKKTGYIRVGIVENTAGRETVIGGNTYLHADLTLSEVVELKKGEG